MRTSQFHTDPLSPTYRFHTRTTPFSTQNPSVPHQKPLSSTPKTPQFHLPLSSTPKLPQLRINSPSVQPPLSSTPKTPQLNTKTPSVPHQKPLSSTLYLSNYIYLILFILLTLTYNIAKLVRAVTIDLFISYEKTNIYIFI